MIYYFVLFWQQGGQKLRKKQFNVIVKHWKISTVQTVHLIPYALSLNHHRSIVGTMTVCWTFRCQSHVVSTRWHLTQDVDVPSPSTLPRFCNPQNKKFWDVRKASSYVCDLVKNVKHEGDRQLIEVLPIRLRFYGLYKCTLD